MSDRLAVSAGLSVLMMSIYVLFGTEAARLPLEPKQFRAPTSLTAPGPLRDPGYILHFAD